MTYSRLASGRFKKENLTIRKIGKKNFLIGIGIGLGMSILLALSFAYGRELLRYTLATSRSIYDPPMAESIFFDWFFNGLSSVLGFTYCLWYWISNIPNARFKNLIVGRLIIFFFWLVLLCVVRFGSFLAFTPFGMWGYSNQLVLSSQFKLLFVFIIIYLFIQVWIIVQRRYRVWRQIVFSAIIVVILTPVLKHYTELDRTIVNRAFYSQFEGEYTYIDNTLSEAQSKYGIRLDSSTVFFLRQWDFKESKVQCSRVGNAFAAKTKVSLDTIILARIIQHNAKLEYYYNFSWYYPEPFEILEQLMLYEQDSSSQYELTRLLAEQFELLVYSDNLTFEETLNLSLLERNRRELRNNASPLIRDQMVIARKLILADDNYKPIHHRFLLDIPLPPEYYDERLLELNEYWTLFYQNRLNK